MKKLCCLLLLAALLLAMAACGKKDTGPELVYVDEGTQETETQPRRDTAILYTAGTAGRDAAFYAALRTCYDSSLYEYLNGYVGLVDLGGAMDAEGVIYTKIDLMNYVGFEAAAFAPSDFAAGADALVTAANAAQFPMLCANLTVDGTDATPLSAWTLARYGELYVAYVGVVVPEAIESSRLTDGEVSYALTDCAAALTDAARTARASGAEYVVALVSCGSDVAHTLAAVCSGVDVLLDGAGDGGASCTLTDSTGAAVLYSGLDPSADSVGKLVITADGALSAEIITALGEPDVGMIDYLASLGYAVAVEAETATEATGGTGTETTE